MAAGCPAARVYDHAPGARRQTSTFLAALRVTGLTAPAVFKGAIDEPNFLAYLKQILVPTSEIVPITTVSRYQSRLATGAQR